MARIELEADRVSANLNPLDEILSLHGSLHVPYRHIQSVNADPVPPAWCRGIRIGTNVPGVKVAGTFLTDEGTIFYDFHDPQRCLTFDLAHQHYRRVVVQVDKDQDPAALAADISARLTR
ncbi:MAG TPA: hypothetical protein VJ833_02550 [Rhodanobacteraceae bacterium]|nr:hypothetical protein [Rhodanobacteraceae bacterium]